MCTHTYTHAQCHSSKLNLQHFKTSTSGHGNQSKSIKFCISKWMTLLHPLTLSMSPHLTHPNPIRASIHYALLNLPIWRKINRYRQYVICTGMWNVDTAQVVRMSHRYKNNTRGKNADLMQKLNGYQWRIQDFLDGAGQRIIRPHFPENCMKIK